MNFIMTQNISYTRKISHNAQKFQLNTQKRFISVVQKLVNCTNLSIYYNGFYYDTLKTFSCKHILYTRKVSHNAHKVQVNAQKRYLSENVSVDKKIRYHIRLIR